MQKRGESLAQPALTQLRKHQRHIVILAGKRSTDAQGLIQGLGHQPGDLGVVSKVESRIHACLERKFTKQRQTEGIDRRNGDVAKTVLEIAPSHQIRPREPACLPQPAYDAFSHFGRRLARERHGQDVIGVHACP